MTDQVAWRYSNIYHTSLPYMSLGVSTSSAFAPATMLLCRSSAEDRAADTTLGCTLMSIGVSLTASPCELVSDSVYFPAVRALSLYAAVAWLSRWPLLAVATAGTWHVLEGLPTQL